MSPKVIQFRLGIGACLFALFLGFFGIPNWVSSPSNVRNIVLAPTFWPYVLTALTGMAGLALLASGPRASETPDAEDENAADAQTWFRLVALALIMVVTMLVFAATAFLLRTRHPKIALVCAVLLPLTLYGFFAHVAGVAIPQGNFVRLP